MQRLYKDLHEEGVNDFWFITSIDRPEKLRRIITSEAVRKNAFAF